MASRSINDLTPETATMALLFQNKMQEAGQEVLIYCTLRTFKEQAIIYRQSRPFATIAATANLLTDKYGRPDLGQILLGVGPQNGPHVTNAAPGQSMHNYGLAFDCVPMVGGKPAWSYQSNKGLYELMGEKAEEVGLEWAGTWTSFKEYVHFQNGSANWRDMIRG